MENIKLEVQHNMFIEIFPEEYFKHLGYSPKLIRKVDIKEITINDYRVDSKERDAIYEISIKMKDGKEYDEQYENLSCIGEYNPKVIRDTRYVILSSQLLQDKQHS